MLSDDVANPALDASTATGTDARGEERGFDQTFIDNGGLSDLGAFELAVQASGGEPPRWSSPRRMTALIPRTTKPPSAKRSPTPTTRTAPTPSSSPQAVRA
ncbi:MAG: hypothetical protein P8N98_16860 [Paracoccaceae bacterium]|nr:hypothetical protein [Paracoccaceae bacterium]